MLLYSTVLGQFLAATKDTVKLPCKVKSADLGGPAASLPEYVPNSLYPHTVLTLTIVDSFSLWKSLQTFNFVQLLHGVAEDFLVKEATDVIADDDDQLLLHAVLSYYGLHAEYVFLWSVACHPADLKPAGGSHMYIWT